MSITKLWRPNNDYSFFNITDFVNNYSYEIKHFERERNPVVQGYLKSQFLLTLCGPKVTDNLKSSFQVCIN